MNQPGLPAYLLNRNSKGVANTLVANLGTGSPPYISINANKFTLIDASGAEEPVTTYDPKIGVYVDCVIIDVNDFTSKIFYDKAYDPKAEGEPPACFSDNGIGASRNAARPQNVSCGACQWNVWGSATSNISGKGVKACHDVQKIAVMIPGDPVIFLMRVMPGSRKNFGAYAMKFTAQQGVDISDVITRISFESQGVLRFDAVNFITAEAYQQRETALGEHKTDPLLGRGDQPVQAALPAPQGQPAAQPQGQPSGQLDPQLGAGYAQPPQGDPRFHAAQQGQFQPATQQAPFAPNAGSGQPMPSSAPQEAGATGAGASPSTEPQRRKRRSRAEMEAAQGQQGQPPQQTQFAPQGQQPAPQAPFMPQGQPQATPQQQFGIAPGAPPNAELTQALNGLFK